MVKEFLKKYRIFIYIIIIVIFAYVNLTTFDLYMISRNPLVFLQTNWFEIVVLWLLLSIYYKINKKDE
ncbi:MAG: hypothetical protein CMI87_01290 [Pelagibacteraceae bacterium]|nr:hypothetical protein [Pelagibacteraceae bacterium]